VKVGKYCQTIDKKSDTVYSITMPRIKPRIILDTNVLYAGLYSSEGASFRVLRAVEEGKVKIVLSTTLLFEYEEILKRNQATLGLSARKIESILDYFCMQSEHRKIYFLWRPRLPDPKDDHLLELAVASGAKYLVTRNTKDFKGVEKFGLRSVTPKELLEEIL
jgi:putative PIN family toxin of toxin-antitoxin system